MRFMISKTNFHSLSWFLGFYKSKRKGIIANKLKQQSTIYPCTYCGKKKKNTFYNTWEIICYDPQKESWKIPALIHLTFFFVLKNKIVSFAYSLKR